MPENDNTICCFTGHRNIDVLDMRRLPETLGRVITGLYENGVRVFRSGGALGFDMVAALKVLDMREKYPDILLEMCLPCHDQAIKWREIDQKTYNYVLSHCDGIAYASYDYTPSCMFERNRMLVDGAGVCVAYYTGSRGGTGYTYDYALSNGLKMINLYDILRK